MYKYHPSGYAARPVLPTRVSTVDGITASLGKLHVDTDDHLPDQAGGAEHEDQTQLQRDLDIMFEELARDKLAGVPEIEMPSQFKGVTLYDHQVEGIRWLVHQERSGGTEAHDSPLYFRKGNYVGGKPYWVCRITLKHRRTPPKHINGAILADDMGLGKTVQTLGLILSNPPKNHVYGATRKPLVEVNPKQPFCTLIVCPVSVMSNWVAQIESHVHEGALRTALYAGSTRSELISKIKHNQLDVVIVSYDTLRVDFENSGIGPDAAPKKAKKKQTLYDLKQFHRLILDESHTIRSSNTGYYKSASALKASTKICLTGTPFVNHPADIHSLLCFLGLEPLNDKTYFKEWITAPIQQGNPLGLARLRSTMSVIALRRTKKATDIELVGKDHYLKKVAFPEGSEHKHIHDVLYDTTKAAFDAAVQSEGEEAASAYRLMFEFILRIRQACCSGELIPKHRFESVSGIARDLECEDGLTASRGLELLNALQVRTCEHLAADSIFEDKEEVIEQYGRQKRKASNRVGDFVKRFISEVESDDEEEDKSDGGESEDDVSEASFEESDTDDELSLEPTPKKKPRQRMAPAVTCRVEEIAPKIAALLQVIKEMKVDEKGVIFSQFTTFLDKIEPELEANGHTFTRIDGSMNATARIIAMQEFSKEDVNESPRFILCSLRAAGTGINLTRGNVAFMMDPWWNKAVENQAMDRVHRLGQKRKCRVYSFAMEGSIEERMIALQLAKAALGKGSMEKLSPKEESRAKLTAMKDLFEIVDAEDKTDWEDDFLVPDDCPIDEFEDEWVGRDEDSIGSEDEDKAVDSEDEKVEFASSDSEDESVESSDDDSLFE